MNRSWFKRLLWWLLFPNVDWPFCQACGVYCNAPYGVMQKNFYTNRQQRMCHPCRDIHRIKWEKWLQDSYSRPPLPSTNR